MRDFFTDYYKSLCRWGKRAYNANDELSGKGKAASLGGRLVFLICRVQIHETNALNANHLLSSRLERTRSYQLTTFSLFPVEATLMDPPSRLSWSDFYTSQSTHFKLCFSSTITILYNIIPLEPCGPSSQKSVSSRSVSGTTGLFQSANFNVTSALFLNDYSWNIIHPTATSGCLTFIHFLPRQRGLPHFIAAKVATPLTW